MSVIVAWEPGDLCFQSCFFNISDQTEHGTSHTDVVVGLSLIDEPKPEGSLRAVGYGPDNQELQIVTHFERLDPAGLCRIYGNRINPWGRPQRLERFDLFTDDLNRYQRVWTNSKGFFEFWGKPGHRMKFKFFHDDQALWFEVPDKGELKFEDIDGKYGFKVNNIKGVETPGYNQVDGFKI